MTRSPSRVLRSACERLQLPTSQLWADYVTLGGNLSLATIDAFLEDRHHIDDHDFDLVVQALNERFMSRDEDHPLPYADEPPLGSP